VCELVVLVLAVLAVIAIRAAPGCRVSLLPLFKLMAVAAVLVVVAAPVEPLRLDLDLVAAMALLLAVAPEVVAAQAITPQMASTAAKAVVMALVPDCLEETLALLVEVAAVAPSAVALAVPAVMGPLELFGQEQQEVSRLQM
jgi:hypothetical protein